MQGFLQANDQFSHELLLAARECYLFMRKVNEVEELGDSDFLDRVIPRYVKFSKLCAKYPNVVGSLLLIRFSKNLLF